jgi:hypothetical protein
MRPVPPSLYSSIHYITHREERAIEEQLQRDPGIWEKLLIGQERSATNADFQQKQTSIQGTSR